MTVGQEFKAACQANLLDVAKTALKLHSIFEHRAINDAADVQAFQEDVRAVLVPLDQILLDSGRAKRYYLAGGTE